MLMNPVVIKVLLVAALIVLIISLILSLIIAVANDGMNIFGAYLAEDEEIYAADDYANTYTVTAVQNAINGVISSVNPDTTVIAPYTLGHNPYALISFLSALSFSESGDEYENAFSASDSAIIAAIELFVNTMYYVTYSTSSTTTTEWFQDADGEWYSVVTTHITLNITVNQRTEDETVQIIFNSGSPYTPEMYELYQMYMETQGFRPDLFPAHAVDY
jgi:hypothetical protein